MVRAVNYCRCSTEEESQRDALKIQVQESREWIAKNGWLQVDEYVEAKSGTRVKGRTQYQRLLDDMLEDRFDVIVIKDQDRLMRNTRDWYLFLDRMLQNKKQLFMYLEGKYYTPDDALITGIRAILAEEYSRTLSKKINNAHRGRQEKGNNVILNSKTFGFRKERKSPAVIDEKEAAAVNRMYDLSIEGYGASRIARILYMEGYTDRQGNPLLETRIRRIIRNPLYKGTAIMNKRHFNFETKQMIQNPESEWIIHEKAVPAIVSSEKWEMANRAMDIRLEKEGFPETEGNRTHGLSHKIRCGLCNATYYRTSRKTGKNNENTVHEWKCSSYLKYGRKQFHNTDSGEISEQYGCNNIHIDEAILMQVLENIRTRYYEREAGNQLIINQMMALLERTLGSHQIDDIKSTQSQIAKIERQMDVLLDKLLNETVSDDIYSRKRQELEKQVAALREKLAEQEQAAKDARKLKERLQGIRSWLECGGLERATTRDMISDIRQIVIYAEKLQIEFLPDRLRDVEQLKEHPLVIQAEYPFSWKTEQGRRQTEEKIIKIWKEKPEMTVKEISRELGIPYHAVLNRVNNLKQTGRAAYNCKGGKGSWEVKDN